MENLRQARVTFEITRFTKLVWPLLVFALAATILNPLTTITLSSSHKRTF